MLTDTTREGIEHLKGLVLKHQVCYEVWPEYLMVRTKKTQVGFSLELSGIHGHKSVGRPLPGCPQCQQVFEDLQVIAEWIQPREKRASQYEIQSFDRSLHKAPKREFRPEVALTLKILHRQGFDQSVDACEERCLTEMREKLAKLGVKEGVWRANQVEAITTKSKIKNDSTQNNGTTSN